MGYGIKANVRVAHKCLRFGALCWMNRAANGDGGERISVLCLTRGGHKASTYIDARDLTNYRVGWVHDSKDPDDQCHRHVFASRDKAQEFATHMNERFGDGPKRFNPPEQGR